MATPATVAGTRAVGNPIVVAKEAANVGKVTVEIAVIVKIYVKIAVTAWMATVWIVVV